MRRLLARISLPGLTPRERLALLFVLVAAGGVAFFLYVVRPTEAKIAKLQQELSQVAGKVSAARKVYEQRRATEERLAQVKQELAQIEADIPPDKLVGELLYRLGDAQDASGVTLKVLGFGAPAAAGQYQQFSIAFSVTGTFDQHVAFLASLERLPRLVRVENVAVSPASDRDPRLLQASYTAFLYFDPSKQPQQPLGARFPPRYPAGRANPFGP